MSAFKKYGESSVAPICQSKVIQKSNQILTHCTPAHVYVAVVQYLV